MVAVDPVASLEITSVIVTLAGREYEVEGHPASDWVALILSSDLHLVLPGWILDDVDEVVDKMLSGEITDEELKSATEEIITVASGRPWWWTMQLIMSAASSLHAWAQLHGALVMAGVRADEISLGAWTDALYSIMASRFEDEESRQKFDMAMDTPPNNVPIDEEESEAAFMALMNGGM